MVRRSGGDIKYIVGEVKRREESIIRPSYFNYRMQKNLVLM